MKHLFITLILLLAGVSQGYAQKTKTLHADYTYYAPENVSLEEAKRTAMQRAQIKALGEEFGTVITQHNSVVTENSSTKSSTDFTSLSNSDVKGEWLETTEGPKYEVAYEQGMLVVRCTLTGKVRELVSAEVSFKAKVLRNGFDDNSESDAFKNGDDMYLSFLTPRKGYLAVYLVDNSQKAYCLLPYRSDESGMAEMKANHRYVLFSGKTAAPYFTPGKVDEYVLTSDGGVETNYLYVIFSPKPFTKAADNEADGLPRELSFDSFQRWLAKNRTHDKDMQVDIKTLTVKK